MKRGGGRWKEIIWERGGWENIGQGGTGKEGSDRYEKKIPLEPWSE